MRQPILQPAKLAAPRIRFQPVAPDGFFATLRTRVDNHFRSTGAKPTGGFYIAVKAALYVGLALLCYVLILTGDFSEPATLALAVGYGLATILLGINVGHDGAHNAVSRYAIVNKAALKVSFTLIGVDPHLWQLRHAKSHHIFPNVNGCDIDIDSNFFLRLSPNHPRRAHQRFQHFYAPFLYALVGFQSAFIQDFQYLFKKELANLTNITHEPRFYVWFAVRKAIYFAVMFAIPLALLPFPWWHVVIGAFIANAAGSFVFVAMLIGTHFADETVFPEPDASGAFAHDFAAHALITSLDWNPHSRLTQFLAGGANAHAAHHLFPHMSHAHYAEVSRLVEETAREFGVPYNRTTFPGLVASHFRFLRKMGKP